VLTVYLLTMATNVIPLLVISGPVGVGKTTIGNEVSSVLERRGIAHTFIDMDALAQTYPRLPEDRFGEQLALRNLRDVWANCAAMGSKNLIVARVVETKQDVENIQFAAPGSRPLVCQLHATRESLIERVRKRELGAGRDRHETRALELAQSLRDKAPADFVVETDGQSILDIAKEIVAKVAWVTKR